MTEQLTKDNTEKVQSRFVHIVESDDGVRRSLKSLFSVYGYPVKTWESGDAFLNSGDLFNPGAVILTDSFGCDAMIVLHELHTKQSRLKVVVLSRGRNRTSSVHEAFKLGALAWLYKPSPNEELLEWTQKALSLDD
jgi:FixJ family two-component response regulator